MPASLPRPSDGGEPQVTFPKPDSNPSRQSLSHENHKLKASDIQDMQDSAQSTKPYTFSERILDGMSYVLPIKKLTPQEYAAHKERKRLEGAAEKGGERSSRESTEGNSP